MKKFITSITITALSAAFAVSLFALKAEQAENRKLRIQLRNTELNLEYEKALD